MKKVVLCIMDGVGIREEEYGNAVSKANTKMSDYLVDTYGGLIKSIVNKHLYNLING